MPIYGGFFLFFIERDANPLGKEERRKTARRSCGFEIRLKQEIEFLAPVLLADYKSAIVTCTAADCKSAETEREKAQDRRRIANPPKLVREEINLR